MNAQNVERLRVAQGQLSSAMNTLERLDGEDVDLEGRFAQDAEAIRDVVESIAEVIEEIEEDKELEEEADDDLDDED